MLHDGAVEHVFRPDFALLLFGVGGSNDGRGRGEKGELVRGESGRETGHFGGPDHLVEEHFGEDGVVHGLLGALVAEEGGEDSGSIGTGGSENGTSDGRRSKVESVTQWSCRKR